MVAVGYCRWKNGDVADTCLEVRIGRAGQIRIKHDKLVRERTARIGADCYSEVCKVPVQQRSVGKSCKIKSARISIAIAASCKRTLATQFIHIKIDTDGFAHIEVGNHNAVATVGCC